MADEEAKSSPAGLSRLMLPTKAQKAATMVKKEYVSSIRKPELKSASNIPKPAAAFSNTQSKLFAPTAAFTNGSQTKKETHSSALVRAPSDGGDSDASSVVMPVASIVKTPLRTAFGGAGARTSFGLGKPPSGITAAKAELSSERRVSYNSAKGVLAAKSESTAVMPTPTEKRFTYNSARTALGSRTSATPSTSSSRIPIQREPPNLRGRTGTLSSKNEAVAVPVPVPAAVLEGTIGDEYKDSAPALIPRVRSDSFDKLVVMKTFTALHLDSALVYLQIMNQAVKLSAKQLNALMNDNNVKDFGFAWLEYNKSFTVNVSIETRGIFPMIDRLADGAATKAKLREGNAKETRAAEVVTAELSKNKAVSGAVFDEWKRVCIENLEAKEKVLIASEASLGPTREAKAEMVYREVICPGFAQSKSDFAWAIGWCGMVLSTHVEVVTLGYLTQALQAVCSPVQYAAFRDKIKSSIASGQWAMLAKEYDADKDGAQTTPAPDIELPIKEDPRFAQYFKMMKVGLPIDAAAIKLSADKKLVQSYEEALEVLALNPDLPTPEKYKAGAVRAAAPVVTRAVSAAQEQSATSHKQVDDFLQFTSTARLGVRCGIKLLAKFVADGDAKNFPFEWEETVRALNIYLDLGERFIFPTLDKVSGHAVTASKLFSELEKLRKLGDVVNAELKEKKLVGAATFDAWQQACGAYLELEERVIMPLEEKLGTTAEARAAAVGRDIISPAFSRLKNDLIVCIGWCSMTLSRNAADATTAAKFLGNFIMCFQAVCSPSQYTLIRDKMQKSVESDQWGKLVREVNANDPGKQSEPVFQKPPIKEDPRFQKYFKMLKIGLSAEAAANQMVNERNAPTFDVAMNVLKQDPNSPLPDGII